MIYKEKLRALIERRRKDWRYGNSVEAKYKAEECDDILELMDEQEEPASDELVDAANNALEGLLDKYDFVGTGSCLEMFKLGAEWQKNQGVTKEAVIGMATEEISINISQSTLDALDLCAGDKVIIQIRKKED